jgi:hypothetical protein
MLPADQAILDSGGSFGRSHRRRMALRLCIKNGGIERWAMIKKIRAPRSTGNNLFNGPRPQDP